MKDWEDVADGSVCVLRVQQNTRGYIYTVLERESSSVQMDTATSFVALQFNSSNRQRRQLKRGCIARTHYSTDRACTNALGPKSRYVVA